MHPDAIDHGLIHRLHETNFLYGRLPQEEKDAIHKAIQDAMEGKVAPH